MSADIAGCKKAPAGHSVSWGKAEEVGESGEKALQVGRPGRDPVQAGERL